ncbi:MAG: chemotaxis protein CheA [Phycisphaerales bacterium]|jgi:two-component system chemotaxis sensor kinase CheA|nr:chemotaxis protein CheA [Phycisphaeraceae bacterium]
MSQMAFDPELMQDFLTESGELLDQLDQDLVTLETAPGDLELLNRIFRALHTIKGSASFLQLTNLVHVAHAAESCLNAARNRVFVVCRSDMDLLLAAVDTIKKQFDDIREGRDLTRADEEVVAKLAARGEGGGADHPHESAPDAAVATAPAATAPAATAPQPPAPECDAPSPSEPEVQVSGGASPETLGAAQERPLVLDPSKADLLDLLVVDVNETLTKLDAQVAQLTAEASRPGAAAALHELADNLNKTAEFFEFAPMSRLAQGLMKLASEARSHAIDPAVPPARLAMALIAEQAAGLSQRKLIERPIDSFLETFTGAMTQSATPAQSPTPAASPSAQAKPSTAAAAPSPASTAPAASPTGNAAGDAGEDKSREKHDAKAAEQTIRVEVGRLEALLNLVGELVLQKNRVNAMSRHIQAMNLGSQEFREQAGEVSGGLDRVTSDLQLAVMKTRMQPLDKIFGKYPRLIRDLAAKLGKKINLVIEGGETEVDKSVIEQLGDPLIHLMRNSCDHGLESPADRAAAGKSEVGTIRLSASNAGGHVEIRIADDGRGLNTKRISQKAIEKGLYTQAQIDQMSEQELCRIIFLPGFSTAEKISDVSGRGVGMDVVRSNIEKVKGTIDLINDPGKGCTVLIKIPLTVAIMSAMMVGVGPETYAVPLSSIVEIVRPEKDQLASINQSPVMRLRDTVLPLLQAAELFSLPASKRDDAPFAVVLSLSERRVGLMVSRLIGQQEVVIKPLDEELSRTGAGGPVSGATVRDDGGVSLIVDVPRLFELAEAEPRR